MIFKHRILTYLLLLCASTVWPGQGVTAQTGSVLRSGSAPIISVASVMQQINDKKSIHLVDIRHTREFAKFKIPGSINITLHRIKTKAFLKTSPIALIHKGFNTRDIKEQVRKLKQSGYDIHIMDGGLLSWKHRGGKLEGDPFSQKDLNKIAPAHLFLERDNKNLSLIHIGSLPQQQVREVLPNSACLRTTTASPKSNSIINTELNTAIRKAAQQEKEIILLSDSGRGYPRIEDKVDPALADKIFYLSGGLKGYQDFLKNHMLANRPKSQRTKETGNCEPCKKSNSN